MSTAKGRPIKIQKNEEKLPDKVYFKKRFKEFIDSVDRVSSASSFHSFGALTVNSDTPDLQPRLRNRWKISGYLLVRMQEVRDIARREAKKSLKGQQMNLLSFLNSVSNKHRMSVSIVSHCWSIVSYYWTISTHTQKPSPKSGLINN